MKQPKVASNTRRDFLRKVAAVGGATGVGAVTVSVLSPSHGRHSRRDDPRENSPSGYRLTDHIRTYYDKARI
jgi:hypothetical protein